MPNVPHTPVSSASEHELLIARLDADDLREPERTSAAELIQTCQGCAQLLADLAALRVAARALPVRPRTRDFRLTPADAARLRPTAARRLLGWLTGPRSSVRPLAGSLAALGIAGLLLASVPGMLGRTASAPAPFTVTQGQALDRNAGGASPASSMAGGGPAFSANGGATGAAASPAALGPVAAPSAVAAPSHESGPSPAPSATASAAAGPSAAPSVVPPPSPLAPTTSGERTASQATPSPIPAGGSTSPCPCGKGAIGSSAPTVPPGQPPVATAEAPAGNSPLVPASALLLAVGAALFGARLVARRLI